MEPFSLDNVKYTTAAMETRYSTVTMHYKMQLLLNLFLACFCSFRIVLMIFINFTLNVQRSSTGKQLISYLWARERRHCSLIERIQMFNRPSYAFCTQISTPVFTLRTK